MAGDKSKDLYRISLNFSSGEQPDNVKLTALSTQADSAFNKLELMVGDLWGLNRPYTLITANQGALSDQWAKKGYAARSSYNADESTSSTVYRDLQIANLARLIGPASNINPRILPGVQVDEVDFSSASTFGNYTDYVAKLKFKPYTSSEDMAGFSGTWSGTDFATIFSNEVSSPSLISDVGDWHVSAEGFVYVGGRMSNSASINVAYTYLTGDGDSYPGASFNVIPDPSQTSVGSIQGTGPWLFNQDGCTVNWSSTTARLQVDLPECHWQQANYLEGSARLFSVGDDPNKGQTLTLPSVLEGMNTNDVIPQGFVYLYDNLNRTIIEGATYYYNSQTSLFVSGVDSLKTTLGDTGATLESGDTNTWRWSIITVGINITSLLDHLRNRVYKHSHTGVDGSSVINHGDLFGLFGDRDDNLELLDTYKGVTATLPTHGSKSYFNRGFSAVSEIPGNDHVQYLHRFGYAGGGTDGSYANRDLSNTNRANTVMGDFVIGPVSSGTAGYSWESDSPLNGDEDSHSVWLGGVPGSAGALAGGAVRMFYNSSKDDPGGIDLELDSEVHIQLKDNGTTYYSKGLSFTRGNVFIGEEDGTSSTNLHSFGAAVNEFNVISTANDVASSTSVGQNADAYRTGVRIKSILGGSVYLGLRAEGANPDSGNVRTGYMEDDAGYTGVVIIEASTSDTGMEARTAYGGDSAWPGNTQHGSALILSPGGSETGKSVLGLSDNKGLGRWGGGTSNDIGSNRGGFVHIIASSDYHSIKAFTSPAVSDATRFQDTTLATDHSPYGRACIDTDRGIDLVVRTMKYLHEENYTDAGSAQGTTNFGGAGVADSSGSLQIDSDGNLAEVRFTTNPDYGLLAGSNYQGGANANFFYKYGKEYDRHNVTYTDNEFGDPELNTIDTTVDQPTFGWRGGRYAHLFGVDAEDYGSNILGAGMVEAFRGFRSDPNQPLIHTYVFPFEYTVLGKAVVGVGINGADYWFGFPLEIHPYGDTFNHSILFPTNSNASAAMWTQSGSQPDTLQWPVDDDGFPITWDQVIKWHDHRLGEVFGFGGQLGATASVLSSQLLLAGWQYIGGNSDYIMDASGDNHTPHLAGNSSEVYDREIWIPPNYGPSPYRPFTAAQEASNYDTEDSSLLLGSGLRANARKLYRDQNLTAKWWNWSMGIGSTVLDDDHTSLKSAPGAFTKIKTPYRRYPIVLNLEFGSNPFNVLHRSGITHCLPYFADQGSWTDNGDTTQQASFNLVLYGRLVLTLMGDSPYMGTGVGITFSTV